MNRFPESEKARGDLVPSDRSLLSEDDLLLEDRARLAERLARLELDRQDLISRVRAFAGHYYRELGARYRERDRLRLLFAQRFAAAHPDDVEAARRVREHHDNARATQEELDRAAGGVADAKVQISLRETYLRLAKLVHPDLAASDDERLLREELMSELNAAYQSGDAARIDDIARRVSASSSGTGGKYGVREEIERLETAIRQIEEELDAIRRSDMYVLMERAERQAQRGRSLLQEIADSLDQEIETLRQALEGDAWSAV